MTPFRFALCLVALLSVLTRADACSVPVFRYALERWRLSPYEVVVFHRGKLTDEQKRRVDQLEDRKLSCNLDISTVDLDKNPEPELKRWWERFGKDQPLPWATIRYPGSLAETPPLMSGSLEEIAVPPLFETPMRSQIVRHLASGETAVVLLLKGLDESRNEEVRKLLQQEIPRLEREISLPDQTGEGPQIETHLPLKVSFPLVELDRTDEAEPATVRMLLQAEDDLPKVNGPIVFLVFGRGRVLCGLHDEQIDRDEFEHALRFLCGKCSCQIKELNPGMDLLVTADWQAILSVPAVEDAKSEQKPEVSPPDAREVALKRDRAWLWAGLILAIAIMLISGVWSLRRRAGSR